MKPIINYVSLHGGRCGLTTDNKAVTLRRIGTENLHEFRRASQQDVDWVRGMGGHVPDGRVVKATGAKS